MNLFLSWSGSRSLLVANAFYNGLPFIFEGLNIYLSARMRKGTQWITVLNDELRKADFGILCVTKENYAAPWLTYEAGALSKTAGENAVAPFLLDISPSELQGPVTQFQSAGFTKEDLKNLVLTMNRFYPEKERASELKLAEKFEMAYKPFFESPLIEALEAEETDGADIARKTLSGVERLLGLSEENRAVLKDIRERLQTLSPSP